MYPSDQDYFDIFQVGTPVLEVRDLLFREGEVKSLKNNWPEF
jgi:hypothetical protein